tara:strand:- start:4661 stop:5548 length:888 start_codon:yes stop_codon:yes gene_type:complete
LVSNKFSRKGIILAGGTGTRLFPITKAVCKQLLPVYDKPMIYYPISTLMQADIREILIITTPSDKDAFIKLLGDGSQFGIKIVYEVQPKPEGLAQAFIIGESFIKDSSVALILGDNLFNGDEFVSNLKTIPYDSEGATIFAYAVKDPERYGVAEFDENFKVIKIQEKPEKPKSKWAITGVYFYDNSVVKRAKNVKPSRRGELEITDLNIDYLKDQLLNVKLLGRGTVWLDTGNHDSLHEACSYIRTMEHRQGLKISCPEEIAFKNGWINEEMLVESAKKTLKSGYGKYLLSILEN